MELLLDLLAELVPDDVPLRSSALEPALTALTGLVARLPVVHGSGAMCNLDALFRHVTATDPAMTRLQLVQESTQAGPAVDAFSRNVITTVTDLATRSGDWPDVAAAANEVGVRSYAAVPLPDSGAPAGVLSVWSGHPFVWEGEHLTVLMGLAAAASARITRAARLSELEQTSTQLRYALENRVVVEQAKGILAAERRLSVEQALTLMRRYARSHQRSLRSVAEAVVSGRLRP